MHARAGRLRGAAQVARRPAGLCAHPGGGGGGATADLALLLLHGPVRAARPLAAGCVHLFRVSPEHSNMSSGNRANRGYFLTSRICPSI